MQQPVNDGAGEDAPTVLLVDDTSDLRALVRMALERRGDFRVVAEAADGQEGVDEAKTHQPDVVLLDIAMPVMSGLEALPLIREASPTSTVIMLSGFGAEKMADTATSGGADGYIQKGLPLRSLLAQVHTLFEETHTRAPAAARHDQHGGPTPQDGPAAPGQAQQQQQLWPRQLDRSNAPSGAPVVAPLGSSPFGSRLPSQRITGSGAGDTGGPIAPVARTGHEPGWLSATFPVR